LYLPMVAKSPESQTTVCGEERAVSVCCFVGGGEEGMG
jgi:hypothetical protein